MECLIYWYVSTRCFVRLVCLSYVTINNNNNIVMCDHVTASSSTFHYCNNTTITNNNHGDNHDDIDYHNNDSHLNCHNNSIMTKKKAVRMKTSPNNTSGVVWAQVSFIYSPFVLFDANKCFIVSTGCIYDIRERERVGRPVTTKNGPKRCETRRLGPRWVFFYFLCIIWY